MTSLYYGMLRQTAVPADEATVRGQADPVDHDAPPAVMEAGPDKNQLSTDNNTTVTGLARRDMASYWQEGRRTQPEWAGRVDDSYQHNAIVDRQVSSSGKAAAKEAAGEWGHKSLSYAIGIEPVSDLVDGGRLTNTYFEANRQHLADRTGYNVQPPPGYDGLQSAKVAETGKAEARKAATSPYDSFWNGGA
jgi:hypothetical protein